MFPGTFLGLLLLAASACPGYWWVRAVEERKPRRDRTQLLEAAELLSIGGLFSGVALSAVFLVASHTGLIDLRRLIIHTKAYGGSHATTIALLILLALAVANVGAYKAACWFYREHTPSIVHEPVLYRLVRYPPGETRAYVTAQFKNGSSLAGWFYACTAEPSAPENQELALARIGDSPLMFRRHGEPTFVELTDHCVAVAASNLETVYVTYAEEPSEKT
jgi:hypothetical protein